VELRKKDNKYQEERLELKEQALVAREKSLDLEERGFRD
jgi:hypothetical protein